MTVELAYDGSTQVALDGVLVAVSASLAVTAPDGSVLESPAVTVPNTATTTTSGTTATTLELAAVTGISPGDALLVESDGVRYACEAATVDTVSKLVELVTGLPVVPDSGSPVSKVELTANVAAPGAANVGTNWRLVWTYSDGTTTHKVAIGAAVVRQCWTQVVSAADVRSIVHELGATRADQWCAQVAVEVDNELRAAIEATGRRPWAFLSAAAFRGAGLAGIRYVLSQQGLAWGGQIYEAQRTLRFAFDDKLSGVVNALAYDSDDDGKIDDDEAKGWLGAIQAVR